MHSTSSMRNSIRRRNGYNFRFWNALPYNLIVLARPTAEIKQNVFRFMTGNRYSLKFAIHHTHYQITASLENCANTCYASFGKFEVDQNGFQCNISSISFMM